MKNTFLSFLALSSLALGANPAPDVNSPASVPVRIECEVGVPKNGITITDETGVALQELLIDHKYLARGAMTKDSIAYKEFKVVRYIGDTGTIANISPDPKGRSLFVNLSSESGELNKIGGGSTKLTTRLSLEGKPGLNPLKNITNISYEAPITGSGNILDLTAEKAHYGRVISIISKEQLNNPQLEEGKYIGTPIILSVTFTASSSQR